MPGLHNSVAVIKAFSQSPVNIEPQLIRMSRKKGSAQSVRLRACVRFQKHPKQRAS